MNEPILKCEKLTKRFGQKTILKDCSFEIFEGDILAFIGPNGAGKTTTIKLILGLQNITSGNVIINGYDVEKDFVKAIDKVGAIVENPDLYMNLTGRQNLELIANYYKDVTKERIEKVVELTGLKNRINDKVGKYSLGMRQRLGIAQALLNSPKLLILDEPTNGLDPEGIKELRELLVSLAKDEKIAIFVSSHNLSELESFCNKVCIIQNGSIIETSEVNKIKKKASKPVYSLELSKTTGLKKLLPKYKFEAKEDNTINIEIAKNDVPTLLKTLLDNKIKVYSCVEKEMSLEEAFLKRTGGNVID